MLSTTHSGLTTCTLIFKRVVNNFCVFDPLSCCEVRTCVAPEAVCLHCKVRHYKFTSHILRCSQDLTACQSYDPLHLNVGGILEISVDIDANTS